MDFRICFGQPTENLQDMCHTENLCKCLIFSNTSLILEDIRKREEELRLTTRLTLYRYTSDFSLNSGT